MFRVCAYFFVDGLEFTMYTLGKESLQEVKEIFSTIETMPGFTGGNIEECVIWQAGKRLWTIFQE